MHKIHVITVIYGTHKYSTMHLKTEEENIIIPFIYSTEKYLILKYAYWW